MRGVEAFGVDEGVVSLFKRDVLDDIGLIHLTCLIQRQSTIETELLHMVVTL